MKIRNYILLSLFFFSVCLSKAQQLEVKSGKSAIVKVAPNGSADHIGERLPAGTRVTKVSEQPRYYLIRQSNGLEGWSYKGNFIEIESSQLSGADLLVRNDVLKIIILDVEVGDAALIICPENEDGEQDVILIDTGENDADRIKNELVSNGISLIGHPITRFYISHYDFDHMGAYEDVLPLSKVIYDHGNNNIKDYYYESIKKRGNDRQLMTLDYEEEFTGGVKIECIAVNQSTDFDPDEEPSYDGDNENSIALIVSYDGFEYFTAGDLTFSAEKSLAEGIRNCDVYHVNHHGSSTTSSQLDFVTKLDPEVSIASNGKKYGHPRKSVVQRLVGLGSKFYQTNVTRHSKGNQPDPKYVADDTYHDKSWKEDNEGARGTIRVVVDGNADKYYVLMPDLPIDEATFSIEK
ncbi:MAG: hypothetical protein AAF149_14805 [Bacteroidota bacterium]